MTDKEKLIKIKSLADKIYYAAFNLTTDGSMLRKAMEDYHQFIINEYHKEEPVSEELEKKAQKELEDVLEVTSDTLCAKIAYDEFMIGAKWQKMQMVSKAVGGWVSNTLNHDIRITSEWMNEKMHPFKFGDRVKVIIIKDE